jgi:uncharacterized membrane protein YccC
MQDVLIGLAIVWTVLVILFARWTKASIARQVAAMTDAEIEVGAERAKAFDSKSSPYYDEQERRQRARTLMARAL